MSHRGEESDEDVYLSDPSDDEESKSVDDYEYANDQRGVAGYEAASPAEEMDYALHDAEAEQAKLKDQDSATSSSKTTTLSPDAAPYVPGQDHSTAATSWPQPSSAGAKDALQDSLNTQDSAAFPPLTANQEIHGSSVPSTPAKQEAKAEAPESPIDVQGILKRAAATVDDGRQPSASGKGGISQNGAKGNPEAAAAATAAAGKPAEGSSGTAEGSSDPAAAAPETAAPEATAKASNGAVSKDQDTAEASKPEAATLEKDSAAGGSDEKGPAGADPEAASKPAEGASKPSYAALAATPVEQQEEEPVEEKAAPEPSASSSGPAVATASATREVPGGDKDDPRAAATSNGPTAAGSDSQAGEAPKRPTAMPSLPERKRPGSAMPTLPARPPPAGRPTAAAPSSQDDGGGHNGGERGGEQPAAAGGASEAAPQPAAAAASGNSTAASETPAEGVRGPPANGQRGAVPAVLQRMGQATAVAAAQPSRPETEASRKLRAGLLELKVLLLRIASRLQYANNTMVGQIKYRLELAERVRLGQEASDDAARLAKQQEDADSAGSLHDATVMVIGISGSGKSSTINSLLGREAVAVDPFGAGTKKVTAVEGDIHGLKLRLVDTPGLEAAAGSVRHNTWALKQIDKARRKYKPDLVLYCERLDMMRRDLSDIPLIREITEVMGSEMWFNAILALTHATSQGPLAQNGQPLSFESFSQTRAAMLQRAVQAAVNDARISTPAVFVENSVECPRNAEGDAVLPSGQVWRRQMLMMIFSMRIMSQADSLLDSQPQDRNMSQQQRVLQQLFQQQRGQKLPPLPYLVPNMIRHAGPKQFPEPENDIMREDEIKSYRHSNIVKFLTERRKRTEFLKAKQSEKRMMELPVNKEQEGAEQNDEPGPGLALGPSFDSDDNSHLYRAVEPRPGEPGWLTRPRLEQTCLDHTDGVDSLTTERNFVLRPKEQLLGGVPAAVHAIIQKDKNTTLIQADAEATVYQAWRLAHTGRAQVLTLSGNDILYISQLESQFIAPRFNRMTLGGLVSRLGEDGAPPTKGLIAMGVKIEDEVDLPNIPRLGAKHGLKTGLARAQVKLPGNRKEMATGANAEWQLVGGRRDTVQVMASVSQMDYRGNKGRQYTLSGAFPATKETMVAPKLQLQGGGQGTLYLRVTSHDHFMMGVAVLVPLGKALWDKFHDKDKDLI